MFEYLQRTNFCETQAFFTAVDYQIYRLDEAGQLLRLASNQPRPLQNLFALPSEKEL
jgi:hypothetical protein